MCVNVCGVCVCVCVCERMKRRAKERLEDVRAEQSAQQREKEKGVSQADGGRYHKGHAIATGAATARQPRESGQGGRRKIRRKGKEKT